MKLVLRKLVAIGMVISLLGMPGLSHAMRIIVKTASPGAKAMPVSFPRQDWTNAFERFTNLIGVSPSLVDSWSKDPESGPVESLEVRADVMEAVAMELASRGWSPQMLGGLISEAVRERFDFQEAWEVGASKLSPKQDEDAQELSGSVRQLEWMQAVFPSEEIERITKITRFRLAAVRAKHRKEIGQKGQQLAASLGTGREEEPPVLVDGKETEELPNGFGLKPYVRMEGTSMTGEGREGEIGTIHGNEPATEQAIRERVKAFIGRGGKVNFVIILGATNIRLGVMDDQGPVGGLLSQPWQRTGDPDRTRVGILAAMGELLFKRARELELAPGSVGRIGISWAGPGDYANGRVVGTNIEGFHAVDLQDRMVEQGGFPLARELADRLERGGFGDIPIEILHDGAAAAKGEYFLLTGRRADTTYTAGNVRNHIGEQGNFIVGVIGPNGEVRYENRAPEDGSSPSLRRFAGQFGQVGFVAGEFYVEHLLAGPFVAMRFVKAVVEAQIEDAVSWLGVQHEDGRTATVGELLASVEIVDRQDPTHPVYVVHNPPLVERLQERIGQKLKDKDAFTLAFARKIEKEIGQFLRVVLETYPEGYFIAMILGSGIGAGFVRMSDPSTKTAIALVGGFAEKFHRPGNDQQDTFIQEVRRAAGSSRIVRSPHDARRDLFAWAADSPPPSDETDGGERLAE